jgi:hypothetical protein
MYNNNLYKGKSSDCKDEKYIENHIYSGNDIFVVGDTIDIVFDKLNPKFNKSNSEIKKDCDCENENF